MGRRMSIVSGHEPSVNPVFAESFSENHRSVWAAISSECITTTSTYHLLVILAGLHTHAPCTEYTQRKIQQSVSLAFKRGSPVPITHGGSSNPRLLLVGSTGLGKAFY